MPQKLYSSSPPNVGSLKTIVSETYSPDCWCMSTYMMK
jgi:hypothetical protein